MATRRPISIGNAYVTYVSGGHLVRVRLEVVRSSKPWLEREKVCFWETKHASPRKHGRVPRAVWSILVKPGIGLSQVQRWLGKQLKLDQVRRRILERDVKVTVIQCS